MTREISNFELNFSQRGLTLTGLIILDIHKWTNKFLIMDNKNNSSALEHSLKNMLKNLPSPLQTLLFKDVETTNCHWCREFIEELDIYQDIKTDPIEQYIFYMKSGVTLGSKICTLRWKYHTHPIISGLLVEDIENDEERFVEDCQHPSNSE